MQNLEHLSYEIPSFAFNDKQKRTKLEAALSPLSKKKIQVEIPSKNNVY